MQLYELTLILPGSFDDKKTKEQLDKFEKIVKDSNGKVSKRDDWGKRALAYPLNKNSEGVFVFYHLELDEPRVNPIARLLENDDNILRHLLIKGSVSKGKSTESTESTEGTESKEKKVVKVKKESKATEKKVKDKKKK
ncbi:MAG: 30S ribosomal protein S6 [bacterium]|nr:30S ribosomal protein S6 [bacterium]